jgi:hypothetical protein
MQFFAFHGSDGTCPDYLEALTGDPRLRGIRWRYTGGRLIEYALLPQAPDNEPRRWAGAWSPVGVVSVPYDWQSGTVQMEFSAEALEAVLADIYADPDQVTATVDDISHNA